MNVFKDQNSNLATPFLQSNLFYILVSCASIIACIILICIIYSIAMCTCLRQNKEDNKVVAIDVEMVESLPESRPGT